MLEGSDERMADGSVDPGARGGYRSRDADTVVALNDSPSARVRRAMQMEADNSIDDPFAHSHHHRSSSQQHQSSTSRHSHNSSSRNRQQHQSSEPAPAYASVVHRTRSGPSSEHEHRTSSSRSHHQPSSGAGGGGSSQPMLDFNQAMSDFKDMFPTIDTEVIEAVLRANDGAVEATIDSLCSMMAESTGPPPPQSSAISGLPPAQSPATPAGPGNGTLEAATRARLELEQMLEEAREVEQAALRGESVSSATQPHMQLTDHDYPGAGGNAGSTSPTPPPVPAKDARSRQFSTTDPPAAAQTEGTWTSHQQSAGAAPLSQVPHMQVATSRTSTSGLVAPLVGPLPRDFLRLDSTPLTPGSSSRPSSGSRHHRHQQQQQRNMTGTSRSAASSGSLGDMPRRKRSHSSRHVRGHGQIRDRHDLPPGPASSESQRFHRHRVSIADALAEPIRTGPPASSSSQPSHGAPAGSSSSRNQTSQGRSRSDSIRRLLPHGTSPITEAATAMTEDGVLLSFVTSTSEAQLKEDERIAMMLQNAEFLDELRRNRDFISLLEDEDPLEEETHVLLAPLNTVSPHHQSSTGTQRPVPYMIRNDTSPEPRPGDASPPPQLPDRNIAPAARTSSASHGRDVNDDDTTPADSTFREHKLSRADTLQRQASVSIDKIRNRLLSGKMKESTRLAFLQLAKKFQRRQRRQMNLDEAVAGSTAALLDEDSDNDEELQRRIADGDAQLSFVTDEDGNLRDGGVEEYDPGYNALEDDDDAMIDDAGGLPSPRNLSPESMLQPMYRHGNRRVSPQQAHLDTEPITFYAEEDGDDLQLGFPGSEAAPAAVTATRRGVHGMTLEESAA